MILLDRLKAKTPLVYRRIRNFAVTLGAGCASLLLMADFIPEYWAPYLKHGAGIGAAAAFAAQLTKEDKKEIEIKRPYTEA